MPSPCRIFPTSSPLLLGVAGVGGGDESGPALSLLVIILLEPTMCLGLGEIRLDKAYPPTWPLEGGGGPYRSCSPKAPSRDLAGGQATIVFDHSFQKSQLRRAPEERGFLLRECVGSCPLGICPHGHPSTACSSLDPPAPPPPAVGGCLRAWFVRAGTLRAPGVRVCRVGPPCAAQT